MSASVTRRRVVLVGGPASLMLAGSLPAGAVNIPEGGTVTPDCVFVFDLR